MIANQEESGCSAARKRFGSEGFSGVWDFHFHDFGNVDIKFAAVLVNNDVLLS